MVAVVCLEGGRREDILVRPCEMIVDAGEGKKERCRVANNFVEQFWRLMKGSQDEEKLRSSERDYMLSLCSDVRAEKDRLGGDWAVASVIRTREERDIMRSVVRSLNDYDYDYIVNCQLSDIIS